MTWILVLALLGAVLWIDVGDADGLPWWPVLQVTALFVGAFVVVLLVESLRAWGQSRLREPSR